MRFSLLSVVLLLSCAPAARPPEVRSDAEASPIDPKPLVPPARAEDAARGPDELVAPAEPAPASTCGLPEGLAKADWPRKLEPTSKQETTPFQAGSATLAVLPDTQYYSRCQYDHLEKQRRWLESVRGSRNLQAVLTLGDLTDSNTDAEWSFFKKAITPEDPSLPIILTPGNHDYGEGGTANRRHSLLDQHFSRAFAESSHALLETFEPKSLENALYAVPVLGQSVAILSLEWSPRKKVVAWAQRILGKYPQKHVIVVTHAYLYSDSTRYDYAKKRAEQSWNPLSYRTAEGDAGAEGAYDGEMLWQELIKKHENVFLVLSGHVLNQGVGRLSSVGDHGNTVHQLLSNYQMLDEGGLGYLRLLEFVPDGKTLRIKTYSPSLELFAIGPEQDFSLELKPAWRVAK